MKESYHGKIRNAAGQKVDALYRNPKRPAVKAAQYKGNGAKAFTAVPKEKK